MSDLLSQDEIDALLKGIDNNNNKDISLSDNEKDALGEIGNISMGTAATTLNLLLNQKVNITTPKVQVLKWEDLPNEFPSPYVAIKVNYKEGLDGINLLILKKEDVQIIADLMMGGDGKIQISDELNDLQLSAIQEAMNQMVGSASTSLSSLLGLKIDIHPPEAFIIDFTDNAKELIPEFADASSIVKVSFRMTIGELIDSQIMQLISVDFAKKLVNAMFESTFSGGPKMVEDTSLKSAEVVEHKPQPSHESLPQINNSQPKMHTQRQEKRQQPVVNVSPVQFESFGDENNVKYPENIDLLMDVPLEITVELGRTNKLIKDILEFSTGTVIELDKLAGEPVDILVNGKVIAKGEVVVIDENFGVRITDIVNPANRL